MAKLRTLLRSSLACFVWFIARLEILDEVIDMSLIFVDCESDGPCPGKGELTEFGAVEFKTRKTFHGVLWEANPHPDNSAIPLRTGKQFDAVAVYTAFDLWLAQFKSNGRPVFVSDNPAFDWQWINYGFWHTLNKNPFGFSARRIGDFAAGLAGDFYAKQDWKRLRQTRHDHNPVNDSIGNAEAFAALIDRSK
jgi:hypothetical protein